MAGRRYSTGEFAKKANVSIRTIHYYNEKGLIKPSFISEAGYRYYSDRDFARLQKILTLKHLGFSLEEIRTISLREDDTDFLSHSFALQLELVRKRIEHLQFVEKSIRKTKEKFDAAGEVDWEEMTQLIQIVDMERDLVEQYKNEKNIKSRINLHEKYSHNPKGWFPWLFEQVENEPVRTVLELGCGDGAFWKSCRDRIPPYWDITLSDVSRGMLEDAEKNLKKIPGKRKYLVADCQSIPCKDNSFDLVLAHHVLFYPKDLQAALSEICRVLKPGGTLCCATYGRNHMREIEELVREFDEEITLSRIRLYENFGLENGRELLEEYFTEISLHEYPDYLEVSEAEPLLDYILSCHGNQRERLAPKYDRFKAFLEKKMSSGGFIRITKQAGAFLARTPKR